MAVKYDFGGYATRNDIECADGLIIRSGAFKDCDGKKVPLVYQHNHDDPNAVIGHGVLENRNDGVYLYGLFNDTEEGQHAKESMLHGDLSGLSIWANHLVKAGSDVMHGVIQEVSLVLAGANPGAFIEEFEVVHTDMTDPNNAIIFSGLPITMGVEGPDYMEHADEPSESDDSDESDETIQAAVASMNEKQKKALYYLVSEAAKSGSSSSDTASHDDVEDGVETVEDAVNSMNEKQKKALHYLVSEAASEKGESEVKHNVFETDHPATKETVLSHDDMKQIISDASRPGGFGSLKASAENFLAHSGTPGVDYGITDINWLYPDYKNLTDKPGFIKRQPDSWVNDVMSGVHHTPFSRIKMMFADLRPDDARAKGYAEKGKLKKEEVFGLLKRTVEPTTIYKKQKLDRDDIIDITDFDVVSWIKGEMRMMLDEEIARAILFGDGRSTTSDDKIDDSKIIPVASDTDLYTIHYTVTPDTDEEFAHAFITASVKSQDTYEGSGNLTMFLPRATVTDMLLFEDRDGHRMYKTLSELALALNVNKIVQVPATIIPSGVLAVMVDLKDYNVGADKGGAVSMFDDFDINYNQQLYLIETRCSGALTKPFSAIVLEE